MNPAIDPAEIARSARGFLSACGLAGRLQFTPLQGGANNRVFRLHAAVRSAVLKIYFQDADDPRDRFAHERAFYTFAWGRGIRRTPEPLGWESGLRLGLFEWVQGIRLDESRIDQTLVEEAADFVVELNRETDAEALALPLASEACFSIDDHLATIGRRVGRLDAIQAVDDVSREAAAFVREKVDPAWREVEMGIRRTAGRAGGTAPLLSGAGRCVSPSDFGFHNALLAADGRLRFLDFEYAGWDDPAKLVCDFFCQPELPVPADLWGLFTERLARGVSWTSDWRERAVLLLPAYRIKWCCILLNEFLPTGRNRRAFARGTGAGTGPDADSRPLQLEKVRRLWRTIKPAS